MADLSGVLGRVPGLAGYLGARQIQQQEGAQELAQAQNLMGILSAAQQQQQRSQAMQNQQEFRAGMRPDMTEPELLAHSRRFINDPKDIATLIQQEQLKRAQLDSTKATALNNLSVRLSTEARHAYEFAQKLPIQQQDAALREIKAKADAAFKAGSLQIQAGNLNYNTGADTSSIMDVVDQLRRTSQQPGALSTAPTGALSQPAPATAPTAPRVPSPVDFPRRGPTDGLPQQLQIIQKEIADELALADQYRDNPQQAEVHRRNAQSLQSELAKIAPQTAPAPQAAPPNNFDARDLRLQQGALSGLNPQTLQGVLASAMPPPPQSAAPAQAPAPSQPVAKKPGEFTAADAPAGMTVPRRRDEWAAQQNKASIAGAGILTPESLQFTARQYLAGDRQSVQGFARNATARIALQNAIVDEAAKQGMSPQMVAAQIADFAGTMAGSRTVGTRAANINLAATEAQEMLGIVKEQSDKFPRGNFVPWNMALRAYETNTGRPEVVAFGASVNALVNVYARAINPTGVPTVHDKQEARKVLDTVQSPPQVDAVLSIINRELEIAKKAPLTVRQATRNSITGNATPAAGAKPSAADFFK